MYALAHYQGVAGRVPCVTSCLVETLKIRGAYTGNQDSFRRRCTIFEIGPLAASMGPAVIRGGLRSLFGAYLPADLNEIGL